MLAFFNNCKNFWKSLPILLFGKSIFDDLDASRFEQKAKKSTGSEKNVRAIFDYHDPLVRQAIWELKYYGNKKAVSVFSTILFNRLQTIKFEDKPVIIGIPSSRKRQREKGFNQMECIAEALSHMDKGHFFDVYKDVLYKIKDTKPQVSVKDRALRLENLIGSFGVKNAWKICGRTVVLIDDVLTTGATIREARSCLLEEGAKQVIGYTLAH